MEEILGPLDSPHTERARAQLKLDMLLGPGFEVKTIEPIIERWDDGVYCFDNGFEFAGMDFVYDYKIDEFRLFMPCNNQLPTISTPYRTAGDFLYLQKSPGSTSS
jgi:hypothetical protein